MAKLNFNLGDYTAISGVETVPTGWYAGKIVSSDTVETNAKDGENIILDIEITHGQYNGTTVRFRGLLHSKNENASGVVDYTRRLLKRLNDVLGLKATIKDTKDWHDKEFMFKVVSTTSQWTDGKGELRESQQNRFQNFKAYEGPPKEQELAINGGEEEPQDWTKQVAS